MMLKASSSDLLLGSDTVWSVHVGVYTTGLNSRLNLQIMSQIDGDINMTMAKNNTSASSLLSNVTIFPFCPLNKNSMAPDVNYVLTLFSHFCFLLQAMESACGLSAEASRSPVTLGVGLYGTGSGVGRGPAPGGGGSVSDGLSSAWVNLSTTALCWV